MKTQNELCLDSFQMMEGLGHFQRCLVGGSFRTRGLMYTQCVGGGTGTELLHAEGTAYTLFMFTPLLGPE